MNVRGRLFRSRPSRAGSGGRPALGDFLDESSFWRPEFLSGSSAWIEHAPFGFWLVGSLRPAVVVELGAYTGFSYLAFCQAVRDHGVDCRSFAVDTWEGDDHTLSYDSSVLEALRAYHDPRYASFSTLLRSTFDDAVSGFADGSVDLLHIDGFHTYDAVRHDFTTWRPKLSDRSVVLFHDTQVQVRDFGVHRFWAEVRRKHPAFEFVHGNGLGLLVVGPAAAEQVRALGAAQRDRTVGEAVRAAYARLGRLVSLEVGSSGDEGAA